MRIRLASAKSLHREVPLTFRETVNAPITNGFVDALLQEPDGSFCAIDWKTDRVAEGADEQAAENYRAQLQAYGRGLRQALRLEHRVRLVVHFLRTDRSVDVS